MVRRNYFDERPKKGIAEGCGPSNFGPGITEECPNIGPNLRVGESIQDPSMAGDIENSINAAVRKLLNFALTVILKQINMINSEHRKFMMLYQIVSILEL